jgi:arginyl-tRNA synthetase
MTEAMKSIVKYIKANPGVERAEILKVVFNFSVISPSSLGSNLNSLIAQKIITSNGRTTKRKFYVIEAENV